MSAILQEKVELPRAELLKLAAVDSIFYCRAFFPGTFRQGSPDWHRDYWSKFEDPRYDFFGAEIFRGGAKTTLTRAGISKRIAFAISRNILSVAISEAMAIHTVRWIKRQIENNHYWTDTFQLVKGKKWTDDWIEIINVPFECTINVIAKGMTSGLRGLNPDDWRPDFISADDISNEESVGTPEQRTKNAELFFGALVPVLAPKSEAPMRKLVLNQTSLHKEDIISQAHKDPAFQTVRYPKLVRNERNEEVSAWPARFPTEEVLKEREFYTQRNQYHIWLREYGCKIVSRETAPLDASWLKYYSHLPTNLVYYVGLDPATDSDKKKAHRTACVVVGVDQTTADVYLVGYTAQQGKNPDEMWVWLLNIYRTLHPRQFGVETIAFQKMLSWYFKKKMAEAKTFFPITEIADKRSKTNRIIQAYTGIASQGHFWVSRNQTEFIQAFTDWQEGQDSDLLDAGAHAISLANPWMIQGGSEEFEGENFELAERDIPDLVFEGGAP